MKKKHKSRERVKQETRIEVLCCAFGLCCEHDDKIQASRKSTVAAAATAVSGFKAGRTTFRVTFLPCRALLRHPCSGKLHLQPRKGVSQRCQRVLSVYRCMYVRPCVCVIASSHSDRPFGAVCQGNVSTHLCVSVWVVSLVCVCALQRVADAKSKALTHQISV